MPIVLFVGDNDDSLGNIAKKFDKNAHLIDSQNYLTFLESENVTGYTSHSDLPKITDDDSVIYDVFKKADTIYYCPPNTWSDETKEFQIVNQKYLTEFFLYLVQKEKENVNGLSFDEYVNTSYTKLYDSRNTELPSLWAAGCSITHGVGVSEGEKYSSLIAQKLNMNLIDVSRGGSSIEFAADQILRSDIRKDDIIIWGLTQEMRFTTWKNNQPRAGKWTDKVHLSDETHLYKSVISIHQVINFCNKLGARLILLPIISTERLRLLLSSQRDYYELPYQTKPIDYGSDGLHPGPNQHQFYANFCLNILEKGDK